MRGRLVLLAALIAALAAPAAMAQNLFFGVGPSYRASGAVAAYTPAGVTFHPETMYGVIGSALGANGGVDTPRMIVSWWERSNNGSATPATTAGGDGGWTSYLVLAFGNNAQTPTPSCNAETCPGFISVYDNAGSTLTLRSNFNDTTGSANHGYEGTCVGCAVAWNDTWHHFLLVADLNYSQGSKRSALYVDGVKNTTYTGGENGTIGAFNINLNSPLGWALNTHSNSGAAEGAFDIADLFIDTHTTSLAGCAAIIDASNNVCPALVAKFYSAGPVDIGGASNCSTPLGSQPELCFSGDKSHFLTNRGNATAALTLYNPSALSSGLPAGIATPFIYTASTSPAGPPAGRPYFAWVRNSKTGTLTASSTTFPAAITNLGAPIAAGDLIILAVNLADTSTSFNRAIVTPTGWTLVPSTGAGNPYVSTGTHPGNYALFYYVATAGDVTASGANWTNAPSISWTANANALRTASWQMTAYKGANATTPIQAAASQFNISTSTTATAPSVTATSASSLLVSVFTYWQALNTAYPPASQDLRFKRFITAAGGATYSMWSDEALVTAGATGARVTGTQSSAEASLGTNIVLTK